MNAVGREWDAADTNACGVGKVARFVVGYLFAMAVAEGLHHAAFDLAAGGDGVDRNTAIYRTQNAKTFAFKQLANLLNCWHE